MEFISSQLMQFLILVGGLVSVWVKTQTKLRELDIKIVGIENKIAAVEKQDDKIMEKLEHISEQLNQLKIDLNNKQDRA